MPARARSEASRPGKAPGGYCTDLSFRGQLCADMPAAWQGHLDAVRLEGAPKLDEVVFFHVPSKSLVCTDLVFNIQSPRGWAVWPLLKMMGTYKRFAMSNFWKLLAKDRAKLGECVERVLAWDIERVVVAHGEIVEDDARRRLAHAAGARYDVITSAPRRA